MQVLNFSAVLLSVGLLMAAPAFAQTAQVQKQPTQEGAPAFSEHCSLPYNANPAADPDCKQHTQNVSPSPSEADNSHK
ncbi:MAG: hypothetical protein ABSE20_09745 [Acetobacteraceae bacterium]|jgi:hypothetical protein